MPPSSIADARELWRPRFCGRFLWSDGTTSPISPLPSYTEAMGDDWAKSENRRSGNLVWLAVGVVAGMTVGCDSPPQATYHRDVAPVLLTRCATCHRPDGAGPFSLLTYEDARKRARQIADVTHRRFMPPWLPEAGHEPLQGDRRLNDQEVALLAAWSAAGAPEGNPAESPAVPEFPVGWQLGKPDLVLESPPFALPADGPDRFRNFVLTVPSVGDHWIKAVELQPEKPQVTHHARLGIDVNNESARRDAADAEVGYEGMAWGQDPAGQLITWTPGMRPDAGTPGAAWLLTSDANLVLHTHLQPPGKRETVRFRLGFYYADSPPIVAPQILRIGSRDIDIPPGETHYQVSDTYELPIGVDLEYAFPHAHSLCREIVIQAALPGSETRTLLAIRRFDENWHDTYRFARPVRLPRGTRLMTQFTYDNSAGNPRNPHHPPQRVVYGSNADDEMCDVYLQVIPVDPNQSAVLAEHYNHAELDSKIVGYRKALEVHPNDPWNAEILASCYLAAHQPRQAIALLTAKPELLKSSPQAMVLLGLGYLANGDTDQAEARLRQALAADDQLSLAWLGLGQTLAAKSKSAEAELAFRRAIELAPRQTVARMDLADLLVGQQRLDEAAAMCREGIDFSPEDHRPQLKLANVFALQNNYSESLERFAEARKLAPYLYSPQSSLAIACFQLGDEQAAQRLLQESLALDANDPVPHCYLGQIASRRGELQTAREELDQAARLPLPTAWPESHRRQFLTLVYAEQLQLADTFEDKPLARQAIAALLQMDPENKSLVELQRRIDAAP